MGERIAEPDHRETLPASLWAGPDVIEAAERVWTGVGD
jgi:hypothetical protein